MNTDLVGYDICFPRYECLYFYQTRFWKNFHIFFFTFFRLFFFKNVNRSNFFVFKDFFMNPSQKWRYTSGETFLMVFCDFYWYDKLISFERREGFPKIGIFFSKNHEKKNLKKKKIRKIWKKIFSPKRRKKPQKRVFRVR